MTIALRLRSEAEQDLADAACPDSSLSVWSLLSGRKHRNCCCSGDAWQQESTSVEEPHITNEVLHLRLFPLCSIDHRLCGLSLAEEWYDQETYSTGAYLRELLDELALSQYRLANDIGGPAMRINYVVNGKRDQ